MEKRPMLNFHVVYDFSRKYFNLWGLSFFPFAFSFLWCLELQIVVKVYSKDKAKAKQSEGLCEWEVEGPSEVPYGAEVFWLLFFHPSFLSLPPGLYFCS